MWYNMCVHGLVSMATAPRQPPLRWEKQHDATSDDLYQKGFLDDSNSPWAYQLLIVCQKVTLAVGWL